MGQRRTDGTTRRAQFRDRIESYVLTTGSEAVPQRVIGHLAGHPRLAREVWAANAETWWSHPDVDEQAWIHLQEAIEALA